MRRLLVVALCSGWIFGPVQAQGWSQSGLPTITPAVAERGKAAAEERQKKLQADVDQLLAMARSLKTTVDATKKDELSMEVIREADKIERLAKSVKDRMRQ